jgi:hypothetical protein
LSRIVRPQRLRRRGFSFSSSLGRRAEGLCDSALDGAFSVRLEVVSPREVAVVRFPELRDRSVEVARIWFRRDELDWAGAARGAELLSVVDLNEGRETCVVAVEVECDRARGSDRRRPEVVPVAVSDGAVRLCDEDRGDTEGEAAMLLCSVLT